MEYIYKDNHSNSTFIGLHGTGGNEKDLLSVAQYLNPTYNYVGIQGDVIENGMRRFFKRHAEGQYDINNLNQQGEKLASFIEQLSERHQFNLDKVILLGFSNGANIAIHLLLNDKYAYDKGILLHPMYPVPLDDGLNLNGKQVFTSMGKEDPIVPIKESERVIEIFESHGASVETYWGRSHQIESKELESAKRWIVTLGNN
ncbi:alpha/beta hydrolase [Aerococcaceae bacterium DSM 111020]|nr:alpha/beta hydrolase [Aerococcaceae bacterium DSM 111020]